MADSRLMMNIKGISSTLIPRIFYQKELENILKSILKLDKNTFEKVHQRLHFYNKINKDFSKELFSSKDKTKINILPFSKTSYAFDAYKISKYFNDNFLWIKSFLDINHNFDIPTICKSRPVDNLKGSNANNVLLKLDSNRHFCFFKDELNFEDKKDKAVFRGACFQPLRQRFLSKCQANENCDIANILKRNSIFKRKNYLSKKNQCAFKFIISLEGNDVSSNLKWAMYSNSLVLAPKMTCESWFMESLLVPNEHFALLDDDFSNLNELINFYIKNPKKAKQIITNAHSYCFQFFDKKIEFFISVLVLLKYFYYSNQLKENAFDQGILDFIKA